MSHLAAEKMFMVLWLPLVAMVTNDTNDTIGRTPNGDYLIHLSHRHLLKSRLFRKLPTTALLNLRKEENCRRIFTKNENLHFSTDKTRVTLRCHSNPKI